MAELNTITCEQLMRQIGTPSAPVIIDVRLAEDVAAQPWSIPTALSVPHDDISRQLERCCGKHCVIVCHKGKKLSHGVAAWLRSEGISAEVLQGGAVAWAEKGLLSIAKSAPKKTSVWVTRQRPKIDRIACPWLIKRFINPDARFLFVPTSEVLDVAARFGGTAFDVSDAPFGHQGTNCSFDAIVAGFGLETEAIARMAKVVRAADTNRHELSPQAAGLLAISVGFSRLYKDDIDQLTAAMPVYDALYRWARDGFDEVHDT